MTRVDWIALGVIGLAALVGFRRGFVETVLSLLGLVAGAYLGARIAPHVLPGARLRVHAAIGLAGAVAGAVLLQSLALIAGHWLKRTLVIPPLRLLDSLFGVFVGAAMGLALVWIGGAIALHLPGQPEARRAVQQSRVLRS